MYNICMYERHSDRDMESEGERLHAMGAKTERQRETKRRRENNQTGGLRLQLAGESQAYSGCMIVDLL